MIFKNIPILISISCICFSALSHAQVNKNKGVVDSLQDKKLQYLKDQFNNNKENVELAKVYANSYLTKAKLQNIDTLIQRGYFINAYISDYKKALSYCDSIISISTLNGKSNKILLEAYYEKTYRYYTNGNYKETLKNSLISRKLAKEQGNKKIFLYSNFSIGLIKSLIGQKEEALTIYKEQFKIFNTDSLKNKYPDLYLSSLASLADSNIKMKNLDSATYYNKLGVQASLSYNDNENYPIFVLNEGINLYEKGAYKQASDSLSKATPLIIENKDSINIAFSYLNSAKILMKFNKINEATELLKKADTVISVSQSILPEYSPIYELLYENYKKTDNIESQLIYLEKLITYNKLLKKEFEGIDLALHRQYDTPILIESKEMIIDKLEQENKTNLRNIYLLSISIAFLIILSFYYYRKRIVYKKRYDVLIKKGLSLKQETNEKTKTLTKVPADVLEQLLPKIAEFEKNNGFLDNTVTLNKMAKLMGSNSNYLSRTINHTKNKNFSAYLSDLRVEYAIQELKTDSKLLNYTIKAIAEEVGFGNPESFTKAFYAKTNLNPSYFIKQLKKDMKLTQDS